LETKTAISTFEDKINLLNYLISILPVHLFEVTNFKFIDIKNIHTYFLFKTLLLKDYLLCKFNNLKFFKTKKITSYINEIFLAKSLIKFNTYPENNGHFISRRLR
jgi:hypothetical protein